MTDRFDEIARRNYIGRTFELTQANVRQLQDDVDWLIAHWPKGGYVADKTERDTQQDRFAEVAHDLRHAWYMGNQDFRAESQRQKPSEWPTDNEIWNAANDADSEEGAGRGYATGEVRGNYRVGFRAGVAWLRTRLEPDGEGEGNGR